MKKLILGLICFVVGFSLAFSINSTSAAPAGESLRGKILLQVENNGEGWYVHPDSGERYFMGKPLDAFNLMRELGVGITNDNLNQIDISSDSAELPPEVPKSWVTTRTFTGNTSRNTDKFTILGNSFQVEWSHEGDGHFSITAYSGDGEYLELVANVVGNDSEVTNVYERGEMYLDISASGSYEINIKEYR